MASNKKFTIAGTSVLKGETTWRFATGTVAKRTTILKFHGHTEIKLQELPSAMLKADAVAFLEKQGMKAVMPKGTRKETKAVKPAAKTKKAAATAPATKGKRVLTQAQKDAANERKRKARAAKKQPVAPATPAEVLNRSADSVGGPCCFAGGHCGTRGGLTHPLRNGRE